jgi:hypothetical protein
MSLIRYRIAAQDPMRTFSKFCARSTIPPLKANDFAFPRGRRAAI